MTLRRIIELRQGGYSYRRICDIFNSEGRPTPSGKTTWFPSYPWRLMGTATAARLTARMADELPAVPAEHGAPQVLSKARPTGHGRIRSSSHRPAARSLDLVDQQSRVLH